MQVLLMVVFISFISILTILFARQYISDQQPGVNSLSSKSSCFRVAILESFRTSGPDCQSSVKLNFNYLEKATKLAARNGAKLIVFPEDGIYYEPREDLHNCIEEIPDPEIFSAEQNIPCLTQEQYRHSNPILTNLSCMARQNNIYIVANYGTKQTCTSDNTVKVQTCPDKGYYMLNTNVVLDPNGTFIKRYRKYNPFSETEIFDKAPILEHVHFDTPHGRFGLFTCFDLLFKQPALDLVERYNVDTIIFPTWWFDELPILTAIQYQDGWSWYNNVNLISANILRPAYGSVGSAIFSGKHILHTGAHNNRSKLLIANIEKFNTNDCVDQGFEAKSIDIDDNQSSDRYKHKNAQLLADDSLVTLTKPDDEQTICANNVCCTIDYKIDLNVSQSFNKLVLIVRNSPRAGFYGWFEQFCVLTTISDLSPIDELDGVLKREKLIFGEDSVYFFNKLSVRMTSSTKYVYPFGSHNVDNLIDRSKRHFSCDLNDSSENILVNCEHKLIDNSTLAVNSFGMYARLYESDEEPKEKIKPRAHYIPGSEL